MKTIDPAVIAKLAATQNQPILLYEFYLDSGTQYLCDYSGNVTFPTGGQVYTALSIVHEHIIQNSASALDSVTIELANVNKLFGLYVTREALRGRTVIIRRVFADLLTNALYGEAIFVGTMQNPTVDQYKVSVEAIAGQPLRRKEPLKNYSRLCRHMLGDTGCAKDISALVIEEAHAPDSGTTTTLIDSNLVAAVDIYKDGMVECDFTDGTYTWTEQRRIVSYDSGSKTIAIQVPFSVATSTATRWKAYPGCNKSWVDCYDKFYNVLNFGGFVHV
jgi:hypothetical protein